MGETRVQTICLVILATVAVAAALHWLRPVMIPFVLAVMISLGLGMLVELLVQRARVPRPLAMPAVLVLGLGILLGLGALLSASVAQLASNADVYSQQLGQLLVKLNAWLPDLLRERLGAELAELRQIPVSAVGAVLARTTNALLGVLSQSLLVLIFVLFLTWGGTGRGRPPGTWGEVEARVQTYLVGKLLISAATGLLVGLVLGALGIPLAMAFGLTAFLLNFIPNVGSLVATLLPLPVILATPDVSTAAGVLAIVLPAAIQFSVGSVLEPKLMGESLDLHPVAVLVSLIFWGMLWGIVGMLLATPITAVLKILLGKFEGSRPVAELLAGRLTALGRPASGA